MKYSIINNGSGFCLFRILCPESLAVSLLAFLDEKSRQNTPFIKSVQHEKNLAYFINLNQQVLALYDQYIDDGLTRQAAISAVNSKIKVLGFNNISYDIVRSILTRNGRFKTVSASSIAS